MKILVANIGSTSLKWRLFDFADGRETLLHKGGLERVTDYGGAIEACLGQLKDAKVIETEKDLAAVGFKTVIARNLNGCVRLDDRALEAMQQATGLAPAHNPPYIAGVKLFAERMPDTPLVGLFETAFCQYAPEAARRYAVPERWHAAGVQRWGFHGASHKFIAERSAELLRRPDVAERARLLYVNGASSPVSGPDLRVVSCHLGGSSSVTGILNGVGIGNSMGLTPQSGLPHNNRVGDLDAFAVGYMHRTTGSSLDALNKNCAAKRA
jgi:acetate kinase